MSAKIVSHVIQLEATERSLGAKSSNWNNTIPASADSNQLPSSSNGRVKSVKRSTANLHVTVLIYEREVARCLTSSKNINLQYHREQRSCYTELLSPQCLVFIWITLIPRIA